MALFQSQKQRHDEIVGELINEYKSLGYRVWRWGYEYRYSQWMIEKIQEDRENILSWYQRALPDFRVIDPFNPSYDYLIDVKFAWSEKHKIFIEALPWAINIERVELNDEPQTLYYYYNDVLSIKKVFLANDQNIISCIENIDYKENYKPLPQEGISLIEKYLRRRVVPNHNPPKNGTSGDCHARLEERAADYALDKDEWHKKYVYQVRPPEQNNRNGPVYWQM